jgi:hypothetical protein
LKGLVAQLQAELTPEQLAGEYAEVCTLYQATLHVLQLHNKSSHGAVVFGADPGASRICNTCYAG